jgi:uncharacterized protein (TIGR00255 family)
VTIASMTGFARAEGEFDDFAWRWEVRSVNNRGLDIRARMPPGLEAFEITVRDLVGKRFKRGSFNVSLNLTRTPGLTNYRLNEALLDRVLELAEDIRARTGAPPPTAEGLLRLRGVLEADETDASDDARAAREAAMAESLMLALAEVETSRVEEGARLATVLGGLVDEISALSAKARGLAATQPDAIRTRIANQLRDLVAGATPLPEERLAQEIAVMIGKADVREEIDRLDAHVGQARDMIASGGAVGRRLDFLSQEFNREANTLCSKSQDLELTRTGLALKAAIEQFREQVQNIE